MAFEFIKSAAASVSNTVTDAGKFVWENKGKIAACAAAIGVAVYYREEIAEATNGMISKVSETPTVEVPSVES